VRMDGADGWKRLLTPFALSLAREQRLTPGGGCGTKEDRTNQRARVSCESPSNRWQLTPRRASARPTARWYRVGLPMPRLAGPLQRRR